jgi:hypothetical protein
MTWIIILLLILGTVAAVGVRIEAVTRRDRRTELSLAQQWRAMGGGEPFYARPAGATSGPHPGRAPGTTAVNDGQSPPQVSDPI